MIPAIPPEEIAQLMRFIAEKAKNVKSPMNVIQMAKKFKEKTGTKVSAHALRLRINANRQKIHKIKEFDMDTKVRMMFALSAPIDAGFLIEMKKVADVEVDEQQRIIQYKQKDGRLELSGKHVKLSMNTGDQRNRSIIQFLVEKSKTTDKPIPDRVLLREFKENTGCTDSQGSLTKRYQRVKNTIYQSSEIDKNTKIKMMFISNAKLSADILKELRKDALVELDKNQRIKEYKANDGSLELEGEQSAKAKTSAKKNKARVVDDSSESEDNGDEEDSTESDAESMGNVGESTKSAAKRRSDEQKSESPPKKSRV